MASYEFQVDMWSLGCIIGELYCGHPLFPAVDENELFEFILEVCGLPPDYMLEEGQKAKQLITYDFFGKLQPIRSRRSRIMEIMKISELTLESILFKDRALTPHLLTRDEL